MNSVWLNELLLFPIDSRRISVVSLVDLGLISMILVLIWINLSCWFAWFRRGNNHYLKQQWLVRLEMYEQCFHFALLFAAYEVNSGFRQRKCRVGKGGKSFVDIFSVINDSVRTEMPLRLLNPLTGSGWKWMEKLHKRDLETWGTRQASFETWGTKRVEIRNIRYHFGNLPIRL